MAENMISVRSLSKTYKGGFQALKNVNLEVEKGEIFALLGPNGAGKTTLIGMICGVLNAPDQSIFVDGFDVTKDFRETRSRIGLVPQELTTDAFESVWNTVSFSRGLFGKKKNPEYIEDILKKLSLWEKKDSRLFMLSGGMKRRVMIAKALSHEPSVLFLDEPTAGVDVELRKSMWETVRGLQNSGVTVVLTTHYIEEAEDLADRIGVINKGELILTDQKASLMKKLGKKELRVELSQPLESVPSSLSSYDLKLCDEGNSIVLNYDTAKSELGVTQFFDQLKESQIRIRDLSTKQSSLEDIFVQLVRND